MQQAPLFCFDAKKTALDGARLVADSQWQQPSAKT